MHGIPLPFNASKFQFRVNVLKIPVLKGYESYTLPWQDND